jgi:serine/threonine-protein kinase
VSYGVTAVQKLVLRAPVDSLDPWKHGGTLAASGFVTFDHSQSPQPEARIGETVDERYRLLEHLGTGGMASVYRAEHVRSGATFAVKVLHREFSANAEVAARFQREALASRKIQHPNVVAAADFGRMDDGCLFMVLEYIRGEDLSARLYREKPFDPARAVKITLQVSNALVAAHAAGVIHRDLKPDNIMLVEGHGDRDVVKVVDFGIAKLTAQSGQALTALGSVFGTPESMAPEQARGTSVDHRTDLYTLGIVLYEMLTGSTPFEHEQLAQVIMGQIAKPPPPLPAHIDQDLSVLVMQLLNKDPKTRVQTAAELSSRLSAIYGRLRATAANAPFPVPAGGSPPVSFPAQGPPVPSSAQAPSPFAAHAPPAPFPGQVPAPFPAQAAQAQVPKAPFPGTAQVSAPAPFRGPAQATAYAFREARVALADVPPSSTAPMVHPSAQAVGGTAVAGPMNPASAPVSNPAVLRTGSPAKSNVWVGFVILLFVLIGAAFVLAKLILAVL